nr:MAG TPA: hypothetical protein [Caudoviricetes sp.]
MKKQWKRFALRNRRSMKSGRTSAKKSAGMMSA